MYTNFEWPLPHYYEAPPAAGFDGHEPAIIQQLDGKRLEGVLTRFLPSHGVVEFTPKKGRANASLALTDIEQVRLMHALVLRPRADAGELDRRGQVAKPSEVQSVSIEFVNGNSLAAQTAGFDMHEAGLFLFVLDAGRGVIRTFVPASSIKRREAMRAEMRTLKQDGIEKCLLGLTDIHEVRAAAS